ncbi:MAG TPA: NADH-quinone oxidoreductase subunit M [Frankiaceae bacterium]|jgi:NADH-quinone oxidoreductase subunit M|nr:NADH-quinone oxidoreductase subunit M [Frankiaceae bacterium]
MPFLTILLIIPLGGALVVALLPKTNPQLAKQTALFFSLVEFAFTVAMIIDFKKNKTGYQFFQKYDWIKAFGVHYEVGVDGIALVLIGLAALLVPVVLIASWDEVDDVAATGRRSVGGYFALILALQAGMVGVFASLDVFMFYVFFEVILIPMYFIIGSYGGPQRAYASVKFLLYSLFGGLIMLAAVIGLYVVSTHNGVGTFDFTSLRGMHITGGVEKLLFLGFFLAFAIKAPLFPFHTWLPDAGAEAPIGGAVLLVGVLDKIGTFGLIRYCIPLFPNASRYFAPLVLALAVVGIFYGALLAIGQRDMKRLVSYTSLAHFGFIALGTYALTSQGGTGAVLYMVNHGLSTGALFLCIGFMISRRGTRDVDGYRGMFQVTPVLAGVTLLAGLSALSLPGLSTFVSEFLVLVGTFTRYRALAIVATVGIVLAAIYVLYLIQRTMTGPRPAWASADGSAIQPEGEGGPAYAVASAEIGTGAGVHGPGDPDPSLTEPVTPGGVRRRGPMKDLSVREAIAVAPLLLLIVVMGVYPKPVLDVIRPAVNATLQDIHRGDPAPTAVSSGAH